MVRIAECVYAEYVLGGIRIAVKIVHESLGFLGNFVILCYLWPSGEQVEAWLSVAFLYILNTKYADNQ